jgi:ABC-2 type transport system ATP-binding protein
MISVRHLKKSFHVQVRSRGLSGAIKGLYKREKRIVRAVDDISFAIPDGELVGYIGPNGAGKSTTIKILTGILVPDDGECTIDGLVPWKNRVDHVKRIGVVFGQRTQLWWDLPAIDSFELLKDIYGIPVREYRKKIDELVSMMNIENLLDIPVRLLSLGQRMRCDLVASNLHSPGILFLDEPTIGLDAISKLAIRDFIRGINEKNGTTVILTTHDMDDIEALAKRIIIIGKGTIAFDGTIESLHRRILNEKNLVIDFKEEPADLTAPANTSIVEKCGHRVRLAYDPNFVSTKELIRSIMESYDIIDLYIENPPIEKLIAELYEGYDL